MTAQIKFKISLVTVIVCVVEIAGLRYGIIDNIVLS